MKLIARVIGGSAIAVGLLMGTYALERSMAIAETVDAIELIESGKDWDGESVISVQQQAERLEANTGVLVSQSAQRRTSALFGFLLVGGGVAGMVLVPRFVQSAGNSDKN